MEGTISGSNRKRSFLEDFEDDESDKPPKQKKIRFPKGKKVKPGDEAVNPGKAEDNPSETSNPRLAATERAKHRIQITAELFNEEINELSTAEVAYEDNENFVEDGIQIDPFNLDNEREEGYFDAAGNFVEYVNENDVKDPWLDSVEVDPRYSEKSYVVAANEDDNNVLDLSSKDIGIIKRRIANLLEPGETVLQALRRLKGNSNKRKEKMSAETQRLFDELTEDANKLLDHGEYNVYHDTQEIFEREAEGYERLAQARGESSFISATQEDFDHVGKDLFSNMTNLGAASSVFSDIDEGTSNPNASTSEFSSNDVDTYDMFADDDENATAKPFSDSSNLVFGSNSNGVSQPSSDFQGGALQNDYVYDETSGYYYSSSLGYYYDPSTGLYCHATSGQWYSYNEESGTYDEIHEGTSNAN